MSIPNKNIKDINQRVKSMAGFWAKKTPDNIMFDDLVQIGWEAALALASKHHPDSLEFQKMIAVAVKGRIIDYLRAHDYMPQKNRVRIREIIKAEVRVTKKLCRTPSDREISIEAGISIEDYFWVTGNVDVGSLTRDDFFKDEYSHHWAHEDKKEPEMTDKELNIAISKLNAQNRECIKLKYYREMNNTQVAKEMGVCGSRITQIHSNAIKGLRKIIRQDVGWRRAA